MAIITGVVRARQAGWPGARTIAAAALLTASAGPAFGHAAERGFVMLLPTDYYVAGGALAVAATFVLLAFAPRLLSRDHRLPTWTLPFPGPGLDTVVSCLSFTFLALLVAAGFLGSRDPLTNPLPLTIWTFWWIGVTLAHALFGNLWAGLNPWTGPYRLLRRAAGVDPTDAPPFRLPDGVGAWPAIALFFAFAWFEMVDPAPDDPARLAEAVAVYWLLTFAAMLAFGEAWLTRGECFSVFFRYISTLAPFQVSGERSGGAEAGRMLVLGVPGRVALAAPPLHISAVLLVLLAVASVSFDSLNRTFWWLGLWGVNPLEYPGRTVLMGANTFGLAATWAVLVAGFVTAIAIGWSWAGRDVTLPRLLGGLVLSVMPISLAFHFAHYLTALLVNGQYGLAAATDPFGTGADLLDIGVVYVTTSFLNNADDVQVIWWLQSGAIIIGHVFAVAMAHAMALRLYGDARRATLSQVPLAVLMVLYTMLGLWLLSTPVGA